MTLGTPARHCRDHRRLTRQIRPVGRRGFVWRLGQGRGGTRARPPFGAHPRQPHQAGDRRKSTLPDTVKIEHFTFATEPGNSVLAGQNRARRRTGVPGRRPGGPGWIRRPRQSGRTRDRRQARRVPRPAQAHYRRAGAAHRPWLDRTVAEAGNSRAVASTPSGAAVLVDGAFAGSTPRADLTPAVDDAAAGHPKNRFRAAGGPIRAAIPARSSNGPSGWAAKPGRASVTSDIEARVTVNGVDRGVTPGGCHRS